ncbi:hypothetical protein CupriaWKF_16160 [Cupriavidus sp. WKF15]|uniref:hypothetical protein n=1 Tax=Cupriavidus sp. WKF15 TaxID=3032282 RepID=UPI0023E09312|nr:hypothetical protein [Cupriavidus sp. WKF15]WER45790.1 hypothetical protein CupriaWKF_16160 [Cupriavidus sp. WKF15]
MEHYCTIAWQSRQIWCVSGSPQQVAAESQSQQGLMPKMGKKNPRSVLRGLESTEVVEETDFTIHALLRRTKCPLSNVLLLTHYCCVDTTNGV